MKKNTLLTQQEHSQMNELHQEYTSLEQEQTYKIVIKLQEQDIDNTKFIALLEKLNYSENVTFLDITLGSYCPGCSAALSRVPPPTFVAARNTIPPSKK